MAKQPTIKFKKPEPTAPEADEQLTPQSVADADAAEADEAPPAPKPQSKKAEPTVAAPELRRVRFLKTMAAPEIGTFKFSDAFQVNLVREGQEFDIPADVASFLRMHSTVAIIR